MKIKQDQTAFQPVTITFDDREEFKAFLQIIDNCEVDTSSLSALGGNVHRTNVVRLISDAVTDCEIEF